MVALRAFARRELRTRRGKVPDGMSAGQGYLVTGATGLIGRHLVERLLRRGGRIALIVRGPTRKREAARLQRWSTEAQRHGGALTVLEGDIAMPGLGLTDDDRASLWRIDHVVHVAGLYDLEADEASLRKVNVDGTRHVIALLPDLEGTPRLHHVSSVAVAGDAVGTFTEDELESGQRLRTPYFATKHEAERLVRAVQSHAIRIYRPSAVVGHSQTGDMDRIDGPYFLFKPIQKLGQALPRWFPLVGVDDSPINMVPVDWVADVIDHLMHAEGLDGKTFHVADPDPPRMRRTYNAIAEAAASPKLRRVLGGRVRKRLGPALGFAGNLASAKFLRDELLRDLQIPSQLVRATNRRVRYDTTNLQAALGDALPCPRQEDYLPVLWDHWRRHLDPDRDEVARRRRAVRGKTVLVTGASSGIGRALAKQCGELGARVLVLARREDELAALAEEITTAGGTAWAYPVDLTDFEAVDRTLADIHATHGAVDVLVNNAARSIRRPAVQSIERFHDYERTMHLNFFASVRMIRGCLPKMRERRSGSIINVLSAGARIPAPNFSAYMASKAALCSLTDTMSAELAADGVHCGSVFLPWVRTDMMGKAFDDMGDVMTPDTAARWILDAVALRRRDTLDGETKRRFYLNLMAPRALARLLNVMWRVSYDDDGANPEFAAERMLVKRYLKRSRLM